MFDAWLGVIVLLMQTHANEGFAPLSVADIVNDPATYADRTVTVTGSILTTSEVLAVHGEGCKDRINPMTKEPFACAISLKLPKCTSSEMHCSQGLQDLRTEIRRIQSYRGNRIVRVLLTGKLELPPKVYVDRPRGVLPDLPNGEYVEQGFGHLNSFPAQMSVIEARVVSIGGTLDVIEHCSVDLDSGECVCIVVLDGGPSEPRSHPREAQYDFWLQPARKALYLMPLNGAKLAMGDVTERGFQGCAAAFYTKDRVRVDGLPPHSTICVRTGAGRYAELTLENTAKPGADRLSLRYITWE